MGFAMSMTERHTPFAHFSLDQAIALRWTLRDIRSRRLKLMPASEHDLTTLIELGLIEMRQDMPMLTQAGHDAIG